MVTTKIAENPFIIPPGEDWFDREELWKRIMDYVELVRHTRSNEMIVFTGDYGCGTTHTLKYLKKCLIKKGATVSYVAMPIEGDFEDLYSEFIKGLDYEKRRMIVFKLVEDITQVYPERRIDPKDVEHILEKYVDRGRISLTMRERTTLRESGLLGKLPSLMELWNFIVTTLSTSNWPLFILIDEFDASASEWISQALLQHIRQLYDDSLFGLCLVFGLKGEPKDARRKLGNALFSRMSLQPIHLYPISREEAFRFLKAILKERGIRKASPIYPFTEGGIQTLVNLSCPTTPRRLLRISSLVFEEAHIEKVKKIDKDFVSKIAGRYGEISIPSAQTESEIVGKGGVVIEASSAKLGSLVEFGLDGTPHISVNPEKLSAKDVIGLLLSALSPSAISLNELEKLVSRNWKSVDNAYISANLSQMRHLVIKEGKRGEYVYRLSGAGESWVKLDLIPKLKEAQTAK